MNQITLRHPFWRRRPLSYLCLLAIAFAGGAMLMPVFGDAQATLHAEPARDDVEHDLHLHHDTGTITLAELIRQQKAARLHQHALAAAPPAVTAPSGEQLLAVQLGAFRSQEAAERQQAAVEAASPGGLALEIRATGALFRLQSVPAPPVRASAICQDLRARSIDCFLRAAGE